MRSPLPPTAIAVIGAGNAGYAMAAHLSLAGYTVRLYEMPAFAHNFDPIRRQGGIRLTGVMGEGLATLDRVTSDIAEAIAGASHIFVVTQAIAHEMIADLCAPHVEPGQTYAIFPGSGASLIFANRFRAAVALQLGHLACAEHDWPKARQHYAEALSARGCDAADVQDARAGRLHRRFVRDCLLYTSDAADERSSVDLGGRRIIKKKTTHGTAVVLCHKEAELQQR